MPVISFMGMLIQYGWSIGDLKLAKRATIMVVLVIILAALELGIVSYLNESRNDVQYTIIKPFFSIVKVRSDAALFIGFIPKFTHKSIISTELQAFMCILILTFLSGYICNYRIPNAMRFCLFITGAGLASWTAFLLYPNRVSYLDFAVPPYHWPALTISGLVIIIGLGSTIVSLFIWTKSRKGKQNWDNRDGPYY